MHGAIPVEQDSTANPQTWDWRPLETRDQLKRNALPRKCNDCFWAGALVVAVLATIGFGIYGGMQIDWSKGDGKAFFEGKNLWKCLLSVVFASAFGIIFAWLWTCLLKSCAGTMVRMSIFTYLGLKIAMMALCFYVGAVVPGIILAVVLVFHLLYFWCVWHRIPMAEATLTIAVTQLRKYSQVMWIAVCACILTFVWITTWIFADYGIMCLFGFVEDGRYTAGNDKHSQLRSFGPWIVLFVQLIFLFWGVMAISYIVHAICAGIMGTWYFGTSRKRTVTDAFIRAVTSSLGSISFAAFIVAVIRAMETMASLMEDKGRDDENAAAVVIAMCIGASLHASETSSSTSTA